MEQWLQSHLHNEVATVTAKRVLLQTCYCVANTLRHTYPITAAKQNGYISVFANEDVPTGNLVVPLFVRRLTSIVMYGEGIHNHLRSVLVDVE